MHCKVRSIAGGFSIPVELENMIGVELIDKATAEAVQQRCLEAGVLVLTCGPDGNVLRLIPPLTITDGEVDQALAILERALRATA